MIRGHSGRNERSPQAGEQTFYGTAPLRQFDRDASHVIDLTWFVSFSAGGKCSPMTILQVSELIP
jgi:hypothetical protein